MVQQNRFWREWQQRQKEWWEVEERYRQIVYGSLEPVTNGGKPYEELKTNDRVRQELDEIEQERDTASRRLNDAWQQMWTKEGWLRT